MLPCGNISMMISKSFHVKTWRDAMEKLYSEGKADYAVLPIENSTAGIVADIYDLLAEYESEYRR